MNLSVQAGCRRVAEGRVQTGFLEVQSQCFLEETAGRSRGRAAEKLFSGSISCSQFSKNRDARSQHRLALLNSACAAVSKSRIQPKGRSTVCQHQMHLWP